MNAFRPLGVVVAEPGTVYSSPRESDRYWEVLVDCPETQGIYIYQVPPHLKVQSGDILSVPFGSQQLGAIAIRSTPSLPPSLPPDKVRNIEEIVSAGFFSPTYWELLNRVAEYYYTPLMQVVRVALPPGLLKRSQRRIRLIEPTAVTIDPFLSPASRQLLELLQASKTQDLAWRYLKSKVKGADWGLKALLQRHWVESYLEPPTPSRPKLQKAVTLLVDSLPAEVTPRQQEILGVLRQRGGELWLSELLQICQTSSSLIKALEQKGYVLSEEREVLRRNSGILQAVDTPKTLTPDQSEALNQITQQTGYGQILLHGVTGSGKTEVYLQAIAPLLSQGKSALVLVPEIGLTPQLTDRFRARFPNQVFVYHSALSDGERYDTWRSTIQGTPQIIIGTRSAIFAPLPKLGLIILDEEHDSSFKQDQPSPTYHARTVAQWRSQLEDCPLILGSATPSLETWATLQQNTRYLSLPQRVYARPMPPVEIVDMRRELQEGNRSIFSRSLQTALAQLQAENKQGILFIHRRGHSTFVSCRSCGYVVECPHCDVSLAYHHTHERATPHLRCHYCNYSQLHPQRCPQCDSPYLKHFGSGTQRVTQELEKLYPSLRIVRFDSDTTRTKDAHRTLLTRFANAEADILVGTQMLTKGLDLAGVTLVGIVSADGLLHLSDYRASERACATLTQVAGRAGRGDDPGRVILQTYTPENPVVEAVRRHEYARFVETELSQRAALNYPPHGRLILLRLSGVDLNLVEQTAQQLANLLDSATAPYEILGPAPATVMRVANRYRWQILLKFPSNTSTQMQILSELKAHCPPAISLLIDVDPMQLG